MLEHRTGMGDAETILVTGASGFLGSWLLAGLMERGKSVVAFDVADERTLVAKLVGSEKAASLAWIVGDVRDPDAVECAFKQARPVAVAHLAALTIPACRSDPVLGTQVNVIGHINVLDAARKHGLKSIVYTSSAAAHPRGVLNAPANIYGVTKRAAEDISKAYFLEHGLPSIGLRPNVVYGFGRTTGETAAISEAIRAAAEGTPHVLPFSAIMCFEYVEEVVDVIARCLTTTPANPIVSDITTEAMTTDDLIAAIHEVEPEAEIGASDKQRASPNFELSSVDLEQLIGKWTRFSLVDGIRRTIAHHRLLAAEQPHP